MSEQLYIIGEVMAFFYENPQNFYKVVLVKIDETNTDFASEEIVITGTFGQLLQDVSYTFNGQLVSHPKYGHQFSARSYQQTQPTNELGIIKYLSSDRFPGIGEKTAKKIVSLYKTETIEKIITDETALRNITGLNERKQKMIRELLIQSQGTEQGMIFLTSLGFTPTLAQKIVQKYKEKTTDIVNDNPYILLQDISGISFKRIDEIAKQLNITANASVRIQGAIFTVVRDLCFQMGHTYLIDQEVVLQTQKLLESSQAFLIEYDEIITNINELIREGVLIVEENRMSLAAIYFAELGVYHFVQRIKPNQLLTRRHQKTLQEAIKKTEKKFNIQYAPKQKEAISTALHSPFFILTGGPGTGKTTVINGLIDVFIQLHSSSNDALDIKEQILLAAPTGRAAKRMTELTNMPAATIHRLLGITADDDMAKDSFYEERDLVGKLLIIDEMSMVDSFLMNRLLKAVPPTMQVVLVGDSNQLPSVGPGQILADLISSNTIPQVELDLVYRQEAHSSIIELAHQIKQGVLPQSFTQNTTEHSFIACQVDQVAQVVEQVVQKAIAKGFSKRDIQVLIPMYKGEAGIDAINRLLQNLFNPQTDRQVEHFNRTFRVGDKVLQLVNRSDTSIYNGDIGEITAIQWAAENEDRVDKIFVAFDQIEVAYPRSDWQQLTLAYCCSIHKAQGSEFKLVVLPLVQPYQRMLKRNLLYTGLTRSKEWLILCGQPSAFRYAVEHQAEQRQTVLQQLFEQQTSSFESLEQIVEVVDETKNDEPIRDEMKQTNKHDSFILTAEMILTNEIDPMIGMENESLFNCFTRLPHETI